MLNVPTMETAIQLKIISFQTPYGGELRTSHVIKYGQESSPEKSESSNEILKIPPCFFLTTSCRVNELPVTKQILGKNVIT